MAVNPSISRVIVERPTIIFEPVPTATSYTIKIIPKDDPNKPIVDQTVSVEDLVSAGGFLKFMYPLTATPLKPLCEYSFTGTTDDDETASGDFIYLDAVSSKVDELITLMQDRDVVINPDVVKKFRIIMQVLLSPLDQIDLRRGEGPVLWDGDPSKCVRFNFGPPILIQ